MFDWYLLPGALVFALNLFCLVHVLRTGRPWWWILVFWFLPWLGPVLYFLVEILPGMRGSDAGRLVPFGSVSGTGRESVRRLRALVERTPTVENRTRLAGALLRRGKTREALALYESCLEGFYAEDKNLWYELAEAYHADGQDERALQYLRRLEEAGFRDYRDRRELLLALSLEKAGEGREALARLGQLVGTYPGQEANFHYARLLFTLGEEEKGRRVVAGMLKRRASHDTRYRRREAHWYGAARKLGRKRRG
jgi:hypothetical protein